MLLGLPRGGGPRSSCHQRQQLQLQSSAASGRPTHLAIDGIDGLHQRHGMHPCAILQNVVQNGGAAGGVACSVCKWGVETRQAWDEKLAHRAGDKGGTTQLPKPGRSSRPSAGPQQALSRHAVAAGSRHSGPHLPQTSSLGPPRAAPLQKHRRLPAAGPAAAAAAPPAGAMLGCCCCRRRRHCLRSAIQRRPPVCCPGAGAAAADPDG